MKQLKWFAVYTRPNREAQVTNSLQRKGIESYCPYNKIYLRSNGKNRTSTEPLFASTVFAHLDETEQSAILKTRGVINLMYWHIQPAIIKEAEINALKQFLSEYPHVSLDKTPVKINHDIHVINGPVMQRKGNVLAILNSTVKMVLPSLGYVLIAETRKENTANIVYREQFRVSI